METGARREFLISKGWIQAAVLVVLFGFFVLGLLAYRTYQAHPPVPARVVDANGHVLFTGKDISHGQQVFLHNGLMEYGSVFGHGAYLGPDYTADYLRRSSNLVRASFGGPRLRPRRCRGRSRTCARTATTSDTGTLHLHRAAGGGLPPARAATTARFFSDPTTEHGLRAGRDHRPDAAPPADRVLRLDGLGRGGEPARPQLLVHEQLAVRAAGRQQADRERDRLVGAVADRAARRDRPPVRRVRALGPQPRLARPRAGDALVPLARRRRADAGAARDRLVLLRDGGAVPDPDARRRRLAALPRRHRRASSASTSRASSRTT